MARFVSSAGSKVARHQGDLMYISGESLIVILFVGLVAGWLAGKVVRGAGFGIIGDIVIGIIGAFIASWLFPRLGIHIGGGLISEIIYSAIGAIILLLVVRLIRTGGRL
jgi:uncharacterized membrane protein YeaQ/YmgE (transglycosylase-associated protein family)